MTSELQAIEFATRCAGGRDGESEARWLRNGLEAWLRGGCTKSLERCLHLPSTEAERKRMLRNFWIAKAAAQMPASSEFAQAKELEREFNNFLSRGPWREWRDIGEPPTEASKLRAALFHIARENRCGQSLSYKTFYRVLRDANCSGSVLHDA
ncbi:hypothetical protein [Polaromonas sp.]|uniref:hypothetical protein n=1 Tax=Polaromonas sp. TaxID=1869339 RepID=UPI0037537206